MEYFDIIDENGNPTGEVIERKLAHRTGAPHRTSHVWIVRRREGRIQILLQKRCTTKDSFPGCYDISSAGHIPAGQDYVESALRELQEELGVFVEESDLQDCGLHHIFIDEVFYGERFVDKQVCKVYLLWLDQNEDAFRIQEEEIDSVRWMDFEECMFAVQDGIIPNCIDIKELKILQKQF